MALQYLDDDSNFDARDYQNKANAPLKLEYLPEEAPKERTWGEAAADFVPDVGNALQVGYGRAASGVGWVAEKIGADDGSIRRFWTDYANGQVDDYSARAREAIGKDMTTDDVGGALLKIAMGSAESIPGMVMSAPIGGVATGVLGATARALAAGGSTSPWIALAAGTASATGKLGRIAAAAPATLGASIGEGAQAATQSAAQIKSEIEKTPFEKLYGTPGFDAIRSQVDSDEEARSMLADAMGNYTASRTLVATAGLGAVAGGGVMGQMLGRKAGAAAADGVITSARKGGIEEARQEFFQSGSDKLIENLRTQEYINPNQETWQGVGRAAVEGALIGGPMGATFGGANALSEKLQGISEARTIDEAIAAASAAADSASADLSAATTQFDAALAPLQANTDESVAQELTPAQQARYEDAMTDVALPPNYTQVETNWTPVDSPATVQSRTPAPDTQGSADALAQDAAQDELTPASVTTAPPKPDATVPATQQALATEETPTPALRVEKNANGNFVFTGTPEAITAAHDKLKNFGVNSQRHNGVLYANGKKAGKAVDAVVQSVNARFTESRDQDQAIGLAEMQAGLSTNPQETTSEPSSAEAQQAAPMQDMQQAAPEGSAVSSGTVTPTGDAATSQRLKETLAARLGDGSAEEVVSTRPEHVAIAKLVKLFGGQVRFFKATKDKMPEGLYRNGNVVWLNIDSKRGLLGTAFHEWFHSQKFSNPEMHKAIMASVSKALSVAPDRLVNAIKKIDPNNSKNWIERDANGKTLPDGKLTENFNLDEALDEIGADIVGDLFQDPAFLQEIFDGIVAEYPFQRAKELIANLVKSINVMIDKLLIVVGKRTIGMGDVAMGREELLAFREQVKQMARQAVVKAELARARGQELYQGDGLEGGETRESAKRTSDVGHKRTKDGDYVGAPPGMTSAKLGALRNRLRTLIDEGKEGRMWYEESSDAILAAAEGDRDFAEKISGLLAIYSPNATVSGNATMGIKALYQWANGEPIKVRFPDQDRKAQEWMDGTIGEEDALKIKTGNFHRNLMRKIDEENYGYDKQGATIDMWMARVFGYGSKAIGSSARYYFAERETKQLAKELGWEPQQVQAALWVAIKARVEAIRDQARETGLKKGWIKEKIKNGNISYEPVNADAREKYEGLILKLALAADRNVTDEFIHKGVYNFATALKERVGQVSWEAMPGKTSGVLPGIFDAPLEQQAEYLHAMDAALRDENGNDLIAKQLGLPVLNTAFGPSAWQMAVGAGAQTEVVIPTDRDQKSKGISVNPNARTLLNAYAAIRGYVLNQEAVVWHYPIFTAAKKDANGVQIDIGRDPTHEETLQLYQAIHKVSGSEELAPAYVPGVGWRVLNFTDLSNADMQKFVRQAITDYTDLEVVEFKTFKSDGDYISNDFSVHPDGSGYKEWFNGNDTEGKPRGPGRSDLQGWVESVLRPRTERVNKEFAAKYGWDKARASEARGTDDPASVLDAAGVTGKERLDAIKDLRSGAITLDELKAAYPAKFSEADRTDEDLGDLDFTNPATATLAELWQRIAALDGAFTYKTSDQKDMVKLLDELIPNAKAERMAEWFGRSIQKGQQMYRLGMDYKRANGTTGSKDAFVTLDENRKEVWIDVSQVGEGNAGSMIYNAVANWAYNNDYVFVGDPYSISTAGSKRRLENMISSALKFKTTRHLAANEQMRDFIEERTGKPFNDKNLQGLLEASYDMVKADVPQIEDIIYNVETNRFEYKDDPSTEVTPAVFESLAIGARADGDPVRSKGAPGYRTLQRASLSNTLVQGQAAGRALAARVQSQSLQPLLERLGRPPLYSESRDVQLTPTEKAAVEWALSPMEDYWADFPNGEGYEQNDITVEQTLPRFDGSRLVIDPASEDANHDLIDRLENHLQSLTEEVPAATRRAGKSAAKKIEAAAFYSEDRFDKWFAGSKVVDANGKPLVVYHGSYSRFNTFKPGRAGAIYFSPNEDHAKGYGTNVTAVYLKVQKLADLTDPTSDGYKLAIKTFNDNGGWSSNEDAMDGRDSPNFDPSIDYTWEVFDWIESGVGEALRSAGYDGVKLEEYNGEISYAVFSPTQIKSAISNTGEFSDTNPDIRYAEGRSTLTGNPIDASWESPDLTKWDAIVRHLQDKLVDTKRVVAQIKETLGDIYEGFDPYLQEILYHGRASKRVKDFADTELTPLLRDMYSRGIKMQDLDDYLWAQHAAERNAQIAQINPKMPDGGSGLTDAQAADILAGKAVTLKGGRTIQLKPTMMGAYAAAARKIKAINDGTLDLLVDYGLETQETVDTWRNTYQNYVPLKRDMEADDNYAGAFGLGSGTGQGFSVKGSASKRALGSDRTVIDILANVAMQRERAIVRGEKNRVGKAVYGLAITAPNPNFWLPVNPAAAKDPAAIAADLMELGINPADAENIAREPVQRYINPTTGLVETRINPSVRGREDVLALRVNGQDRFVFFSNDKTAQEMVRNLKNLDAANLGWGLQQVAAVTRWFASINTQFNPIFGMTNGIRDFSTGMLNLSSTPLAGKRSEVAKHVFSALRGIYADLRDHRAGRQPTSQWALTFEEFARAGGQTGYMDSFANSLERAEGIAKDLKEAGEGVSFWKVFNDKHALGGWLSDYNTSIENAVRLSAYKVARDQGMSIDKAAALAKGLTVNFNKKGQVATQAGALYAFFNAAVQGTARIGETMVKDGKLTDAGKKIAMGGVMLGVMQAVMGMLAGWDDEEPPQFVREKNFMIPLPDGKYLSIPMPLGFHVLPNIGRIATEWMLGGFKKPGERGVQLIKTIMDAFNPLGSSTALQTLTPTIVDPIASLAENQDWSGKPIYREDFNKMKPTAGWTRTKDTASAVGKAMSYGINYATGGGKYEIGLLSPTPDQIDYMIGVATGGVGREALKLTQTVKAPMTGEELPLHKVPVAGRFVGSTTGQASEMSKFYNALKRIGAHDAALDEMKDAKDSEARAEYLAKNPDARLVQLADKAQREIGYLKRQKRAALEKGDDEQVKRLEERITKVVKVWNARLGEK